MRHDIVIEHVKRNGGAFSTSEKIATEAQLRTVNSICPEAICVYVTGNVWNQAFYRMPRQSIECPAGQAFYRIPRYSIECQADQSFYRMPDKNSQAFYRTPEYLLNSYTETILITHDGPLKVHACDWQYELEY